MNKEHGSMVEEHHAMAKEKKEMSAEKVAMAKDLAELKKGHKKLVDDEESGDEEEEEQRPVNTPMLLGGNGHGTLTAIPVTLAHKGGHTKPAANHVKQLDLGEDSDTSITGNHKFGKINAGGGSDLVLKLVLI